MNPTLIENALIVNEGKEQQADVLIVGETIAAIGPKLRETPSAAGATIVNWTGHWLFPGCIDD